MPNNNSQKSKNNNSSAPKSAHTKTPQKKARPPKKKQPKRKSTVRYENIEIPNWLDCTWKRVRCEKNNCKVCKVADPSQEVRVLDTEFDDLSEALFDIERQLQNALTTLSNEARRMGEDVIQKSDSLLPPKPETFPLYKKTRRWHNRVMYLEEEAQDMAGLWIFTEAAADLSWYSHILLSKLYHYLCNEWYMDQKQDIDNLDHTYTKYILSRSMRAIEKSLTDLALLSTPQKGELLLALSYLKKIEKALKLP